jgi:hypothetical protein
MNGDFGMCHPRPAPTGQGFYEETSVALFPPPRSFPTTAGDWGNHFLDTALPGIGSLKLNFFGGSLILFLRGSRQV